MNCFKFVLIASLFSVSVVCVADEAGDKNAQCEQLWIKVENNFVNGVKNVRRALMAAGNFVDNECLVRNADDHKKRVIAQIRVESFLGDLEGVKGVSSTYVPGDGKHAHTTTDCLLRDYRKDVSELKSSLSNFRSFPLFKGLDEADVRTYEQRAMEIDSHIAHVIDNIQREQCVPSLNAHAQRVAEDAAKASVADALRIDNKIAQLQDKLNDDDGLFSEVTRRCVETGGTSGFSTSEASYKCFNKMLEFVKQEIKDQIALFKAEKSKLSSLK